MHQFSTAFNIHHFTYLKYYLFPVSLLAVQKGNGSSGGQTDIAACLGSLPFSSSLKPMTLSQNNMATSGMRQLKEIRSEIIAYMYNFSPEEAEILSVFYI